MVLEEVEGRVAAAVVVVVDLHLGSPGEEAQEVVVDRLGSPDEEVHGEVADLCLVGLDQEDRDGEAHEGEVVVVVVGHLECPNEVGRGAAEVGAHLSGLCEVA